LTVLFSSPNLKGLTNVEIVDMQGFTDHSLHELVQNVHTTLTSLNIDQCSISDIGVSYLSQYCRKLEILKLFCSPRVTQSQHFVDIIHRNPRLVEFGCMYVDVNRLKALPLIPLAQEALQANIDRIKWMN